jgi:glycerate kinase
VLDEVGFDRALASAAVVVTGEGAWDAQSSMGKATGEVVRRSRRAGVPVLLVTGRSDAVAPEGVTVVTGSGSALSADDVSRLVSESLHGLLPPTRRP